VIIMPRKEINAHVAVRDNAAATIILGGKRI